VGVVEAFVVEGFDLLGGELDVEHRRRPGRISWSAESGNDLTIYVTPPGQSSTLSREEYTRILQDGGRGYPAPVRYATGHCRRIYGTCLHAYFRSPVAFPFAVKKMFVYLTIPGYPYFGPFLLPFSGYRPDCCKNML